MAEDPHFASREDPHFTVKIESDPLDEHRFGGKSTKAPLDKPVAASLARRLADLHALRDGMDVEQAVDVLWFYFDYSGLFTLHDENG